MDVVVVIKSKRVLFLLLWLMMNINDTFAFTITTTKTKATRTTNHVLYEFSWLQKKKQQQQHLFPFHSSLSLFELFLYRQQHQYDNDDQQLFHQYKSIKSCMIRYYYKRKRWNNEDYGSSYLYRYRKKNLIVLGGVKQQQHHQDHYDDDDSDDDEEDDEDDEPPEVDITQFRYNYLGSSSSSKSSKTTTTNNHDDQQQQTDGVSSSLLSISSYGYQRGRSSPTQRKAMNKSIHSNTIVYVCQNCGCEYIRYYGKCSTCFHYNTIKSIMVERRCQQEQEQQQDLTTPTTTSSSLKNRIRQPITKTRPKTSFLPYERDEDYDFVFDDDHHHHYDNDFNDDDDLLSFHPTHDDDNMDHTNNDKNNKNKKVTKIPEKIFKTTSRPSSSSSSRQSIRTELKQPQQQQEKGSESSTTEIEQQLSWDKKQQQQQKSDTPTSISQVSTLSSSSSSILNFDNVHDDDHDVDETTLTTTKIFEMIKQKRKVSQPPKQQQVTTTTSTIPERIMQLLKTMNGSSSNSSNNSSMITRCSSISPIETIGWNDLYVPIPYDNELSRVLLTNQQCQQQWNLDHKNNKSCCSNDHTSCVGVGGIGGGGFQKGTVTLLYDGPTSSTTTTRYQDKNPLTRQQNGSNSVGNTMMSSSLSSTFLLQTAINVATLFDPNHTIITTPTLTTTNNDFIKKKTILSKTKPQQSSKRKTNTKDSMMGTTTTTNITTKEFYHVRDTNGKDEDLMITKNNVVRRNEAQKQTKGSVWYVSGVETTYQLAQRAKDIYPDDHLQQQDQQQQQQQQSQPVRPTLKDLELYFIYETDVYKLFETIIQHYNVTTTITTTTGADSTSTTLRPKSKKTTKTKQVHDNQLPPPISFLVIDSIDTIVLLHNTLHRNDPITITECIALLLQMSKETNIPILLSMKKKKDDNDYHNKNQNPTAVVVDGHSVPTAVEDLVDCVLDFATTTTLSPAVTPKNAITPTTPTTTSRAVEKMGSKTLFEKDPFLFYLRCTKNRFGGILNDHEIGVYQFIPIISSLPGTPHTTAQSSTLSTSTTRRITYRFEPVKNLSSYFLSSIPKQNNLVGYDHPTLEVEGTRKRTGHPIYGHTTGLMLYGSRLVLTDVQALVVEKGDLNVGTSYKQDATTDDDDDELDDEGNDHNDTSYRFEKKESNEYVKSIGLSSSRVDMLLHVLYKVSHRFRYCLDQKYNVFVSVGNGFLPLHDEHQYPSQSITALSTPFITPLPNRSRQHLMGSVVDLAVCVSMVGSMQLKLIPSDTLFVGTVQLVGTLQPISYSLFDQLTQEAYQYNYQQIIGPPIQFFPDSMSHRNSLITKTNQQYDGRGGVSSGMNSVFQFTNNASNELPTEYKMKENVIPTSNSTTTTTKATTTRNQRKTATTTTTKEGDEESCGDPLFDKSHQWKSCNGIEWNGVMYYPFDTLMDVIDTL